MRCAGRAGALHHLFDAPHSSWPWGPFWQQRWQQRRRTRANASEPLRTIDHGGQFRDERWRTVANVGGRCARELQNRWSAS